MSLVRTSLRDCTRPFRYREPEAKAHRVPGRRRTDTSRKIPVRPPQRCRVAVRATSTVGLASGPPGGRRAASTLDRATRTVCHTGHGGRQSSRREYPGGDVGQTGGARPACAGRTGVRRSSRRSHGAREALPRDHSARERAPACASTTRRVPLPASCASGVPRGADRPRRSRPPSRAAGQAADGSRPSRSGRSLLHLRQPFMEPVTHYSVAPRNIPRMLP
jgi:hypothetical protein